MDISKNLENQDILSKQHAPTQISLTYFKCNELKTWNTYNEEIKDDVTINI